MGAEPGDFKSADDPRSFPILRKGDVRENLEELIADYALRTATLL